MPPETGHAPAPDRGGMPCEHMMKSVSLGCTMQRGDAHMVVGHAPTPFFGPLPAPIWAGDSIASFTFFANHFSGSPRPVGPSTSTLYALHTMLTN